MTDYAERGLDIIRYLKRHGVVTLNGFGSFPQHHLEQIAKIGAGEAVESPLLLAREVVYACKTIKRGQRGAKKYKFGSYWFSLLGENGLPTALKTAGAYGLVFPDLGLHIAYGLMDGEDEDWYWKEYNDESAMLLLIDNPKLFKKPNYQIRK